MRRVSQKQERLERLIEDMRQAQGITKAGTPWTAYRGHEACAGYPQKSTEQLKAENALEWGGRMNNIRACAMEIVNKEISYA